MDRCRIGSESALCHARLVPVGVVVSVAVARRAFGQVLPATSHVITEGRAFVGAVANGSQQPDALHRTFRVILRLVSNRTRASILKIEYSLLGRRRAIEECFESTLGFSLRMVYTFLPPKGYTLRYIHHVWKW